MSVSSSTKCSIVNLNVGGCRFTTTLSTLSREPGNMLASMFSDGWRQKLDSSAEYFIDRDGRHFCHILNYLRDGEEACIPEDDVTVKALRREAEFYQLDGLLTRLKRPESVGSSIQVGACVRFRAEAIEDYVHSMALVLLTRNCYLFGVVLKKGIDGSFDSLAITWCMGCDKRSETYIFHDKYCMDLHAYSFIDTAAVKRRMVTERFVVSEMVGVTCAIVKFNLNTEARVVNYIGIKGVMPAVEMNLHVPLNAITTNGV